MALRTGAEFLKGLRDGREIWLEGERVADVTSHPKLARMAQTLAGVYDLQHEPQHQGKMSCTSPSSGQPVALSYMIPETQDDLLRRRRALEIVAGHCYGMLGRPLITSTFSSPPCGRWRRYSGATTPGTGTT
jgi:aromatic ring hydroxylase